jgi:hypothetical protein
MFRSKRMPELENTEQWNQPKTLAMLAKIASVATSLLVNTYGYPDVSRLIQINNVDCDEDDDVEEVLVAKSDDKFSEILVSSLNRLQVSASGHDISPANSVAHLFHKESKSLKARLWITFNLSHDEGQACGVCTGCKFVSSEAMLTDKFTMEYIRQHNLPNLNSYFLIDIISADQPPSGMLMLLHVCVWAIKQKMGGVAAIAVSRKGVQLFLNFGFKKTHTFKVDSFNCTLMTLAVGDVSLSHINQKLKIGTSITNKKVVQSICTRNGLQQRTKDRVYTRC